MALKRLVQAAMAAVVLDSRDAGIRAAGAESGLDADRHALHLPRHQDQHHPGHHGRSSSPQIGKDAGFSVQIEPMQFSALDRRR